jgi:hypothetical protein
VVEEPAKQKTKDERCGEPTHLRQKCPKQVVFDRSATVLRKALSENFWVTSFSLLSEMPLEMAFETQTSSVLFPVGEVVAKHFSNSLEMILKVQLG